MGATYLFGDSAPAPFDYDVIDLLRDVLTFSVDVLAGFARIQNHRKQELALRSVADAEIKKLEELPGVVSRALAPVTSSSTAQCVGKLNGAVDSVVAGEIAGIRAKLAMDANQLALQEGQERDGMERALATLLTRHDLPGATSTTEVQLERGRYVARIAMDAEDLGVRAIVECEPPAGHLLSQPLRVERLVGGGVLEVSVPELGGFFRKEMKLRPQRIEKLHVVSAHTDDDGGSLRLRAEADGSGPGFDLTVRGPSRTVTVARVAEGETTPAPFDVDKADVGKLITLYDAWLGQLDALSRLRVRVVDPTIDGERYRDTDEPTVLAERLIEAIGPHIQEVARRTPGSNELVIKRVIEGNRREEIFVSKAELKSALEKLPPQMRNVFRPLGLEQVMPSLLPEPPPVSRRDASGPEISVEEVDEG